VYNRESSFDLTVIDEVLQHPEDLKFDQLPTIEELNKAITNMASLTAPG
jgi:methylthioribose-1-phosphate isomerase